MKNSRVIFAALVAGVMACAAAAKDVLKGVVTFSGDEYLIIAPDTHPNRSGTLVNLLQEDGTRAMGRKRFVPGERVTAEGEWVCKERSKREFSAAMIIRRSAVEEMPEAPMPKHSDYRKGWWTLKRARLEGTIISLETEKLNDGGVRTHIVLAKGRERYAVCVHGAIPSGEIEKGALVSATGVVRTVFDNDDGEVLANELAVSNADGIQLVAAKPNDWNLIVAVAVSVLLAVAVAVLLVAWMRSRRKRQMLEMVASDRKRIAGELHDTIEQHLATAKILLSGALRRKNIPPEIEETIRAAAGVLAHAKVEVRDAVMDLRGAMAAYATLCEELVAAAKRMTASGAVKVRTHLAALPSKLGAAVRHDIAAIVREAMTNAIKHGKAKNIAIVADSIDAKNDKTLTAKNTNGFSLRILNDGEKFDAAKVLGPEAGHFGLFGMKERAARSGLELSFVSDSRWCGVKIEYLTQRRRDAECAEGH